MASVRDLDPILTAAIGARIRAARLSLGISQERLAGAIGVTFQQVQKYENGKNRVAAATLVLIARALRCPVATLLPPDDPGAAFCTAPREAMELMAGLDANAMALLRIVAGLPAEDRRTMLRIARRFERARHLDGLEAENYATISAPDAAAPGRRVEPVT